jgi:hypothetical protein
MCASKHDTKKTSVAAVWHCASRCREYKSLERLRNAPIYLSTNHPASIPKTHEAIGHVGRCKKWRSVKSWSWAVRSHEFRSMEICNRLFTIYILVSMSKILAMKIVCCASQEKEMELYYMAVNNPFSRTKTWNLLSYSPSSYIYIYTLACILKMDNGSYHVQRDWKSEDTRSLFHGLRKLEFVF